MMPCNVIVMIRAAAGTSKHEEDFCILLHERGTHGTEGPFAGFDGVSFSLHKAEHVRHTRLGREVVHLIIQEKSPCRRATCRMPK